MKCPECNGSGKIQLFTSMAVCKACSGKGHRWPATIDVSGQPTPREIINGVYGYTHFDLHNCPPCLSVLLNGKKVLYAVEVDAVGGWVRVQDNQLGYVPQLRSPEYIMFGKVEIRIEN